MHLLIIHFFLFICSGVLKISQKICVSIQDPFNLFRGVISFKSFNSTGAFSLLNHFNGVSLEWALTHRSFPRILPDSSYSPGVILKSSNVWRKNELSSVKCLSPRSFKLFSSLVQLFYSSLFRSVSTIHGGVTHRLFQFLKTKEEFLLNLIRSLKDSWC